MVSKSLASAATAEAARSQFPDAAPVQGFTTVEFRQVMGQFLTGVTVVTTADDTGPHGTTVNSLSALSLDPALLLVCLQNGSHTAQIIDASGNFAVNILSRHQQQLATWFASRRRYDDGDPFASFAYRWGRSGSPLLDGALAHVDCRVFAKVPAGDHTIFIGAAIDLHADAGALPLVFHRGRFHTFASEESAA